MADAQITIRGINPASNTPPGGVGTGRNTTAAVSVASHASTAVGDHLLVLASVDFVSSLSIDNTSGVDAWQTLVTANDGSTMRVAAWMGRVTTAGARTVTARQSGTSGLHVQVWTLTAAGAVISRDGGTSTVTGANRPYTLDTLSTAGDRSLLVAMHGGVQFTGSNLDYSAAPAGMTIGCEQYVNQYSGQQSVYQFLTDDGPTGSRQLTSNLATLTDGGGAGLMFALRAEPTYVQANPPAGPVSVRGLAPTVFDPTVKVAPPAGVVAARGVAPGLTATAKPSPGTMTMAGPAPAAAQVVRPAPGELGMAGPDAFSGGLATQPGTITVHGPVAQLAFGGGLAPSQGQVAPIPAAPPTRVIAQKIRTGEFLHWELPVDDLEITETLSGPQQITGTFPTEILDLRDLDLEPWGTWIHIEEDGVIRASGILQPAQIDQNETLTLEAVGVSGYPKGMIYVGDFVLSGTDPATGESGIGVGLDPADIVRDIWAHLQSYPDGDLGVTVVGSTPVRRGTPARDVEFEDGDTGETVAFVAGPYSKLDWWEAQDCGSEVDSLAKDTPFDYIERQAWNADKTAVDHWIEIGYPRLGRRLDEVRFAEDENILAAVGPEEPDDRYASEVITLGKGEGSARVRGYAGRPLGTRLRRVAVVDDKSIESTTSANSESRTELESRQALEDISEALVAARHPNASLGGYSVGDEALFEADVPWIGELRLWQRILTITYAPGAENVKLGLRSASSFIYGGPASG